MTCKQAPDPRATSRRTTIARGARSLLWAVSFATLLPPTGALAQTTPLSGVLHVIWDDHASGSDPDGRLFFLVRPDGSAVRLLPSPGGVGADALEAYDRRNVEVFGEAPPAPQPSPGAGEVVRVRSVREAPSARAAAATTVVSTTAKDFVTVLCRYADDTSTPFTPSQAAVVHGPDYPGIRQFYRELSQDPTLMSGSTVRGWYDLPQPRSYYVSGTSTNFGALARDCTAAADADVVFTEYYGINLQINGALSTRSTPPYDVLSFGGGWTLTLDGQTRSYGMTWLSGDHYDNYVVTTHEMGHALGWPHSSGKYGNEYDSKWDVMSVGYLRWEPPYGWLTIHTISHHKNLAGWIPSARRWAPAMGATETATIVRSALPPGAGYLMAEIPIAGGKRYTVEARLPMGHDTPLPGQAIVIHEAEGSRAYVVDPDNNGDPNDEGAMWKVGESFVDAVNQVTIAVEAALSDGFVVKITRGAASTCTVTVAASPTNGGSAAVTAGGATGGCGRSVTVTATPNSGWSFTHWTVGGAQISAGASYTFTLGSNRALVANFTQQQCAVAVSANPSSGGSAAVASGGETGACGRQVTVTATPNQGWAFLRWTEGGAPVSTSVAYTFTPSVDRALVAEFEKQCTVSVSAEPSAGGAAAVSQGAATGACGRSVTVTATPNAGWVFLEWTEDGAMLAGSPSATLTLEVDRSVTAHFVAAQDLANRFREALLGQSDTLTPTERSMLDREGNANGTLDVGDLLAFLDRNPAAAGGGR